jgi:protein-S-isoprenylcysteine O-methyltransferase Ste14
VVGSFLTYVAVAEATVGRARVRRQATTRSAVGVARWAPTFAWVPYLIVALHLGPELSVDATVRWVGVALTVAGVAFALWALATLGRHFDLEVEVHRDHEVVRSGPYRVVRHPIYAGLLAHTAGACLATGNVLLAAGSALVTLPLLYYRAHVEEQLLRAQLDAAYDDYARKVGMLLPFVGRAPAK